MTATAEDRVVAGRYRLLRMLGSGGMGRVWAARDEVLGREVAVKEILPPHGLGPEQREVVRQRTLREARAAARIAHPSAVTVHDVVEEDGHPWIVMQLLPPRTLADVVASSGPLPPAMAAQVGLDVLDALQAAHTAGVLHRDVKPANVMMSDSGRAVLTDFGIATLDGDPSLTSTGLVMGSPSYVAPERARGGAPTPAGDLWSLGATLFTAVEGVAPFEREGQLATLNAVAHEPAPPAEHAGPLRPVLERLLSRDPETRPSADEARALLLRAADDAEAEAALAPVVAPAPPIAVTPVADTALAPALPAEQQAEDPAAPVAAPPPTPVAAPAPAPPLTPVAAPAAAPARAPAGPPQQPVASAPPVPARRRRIPVVALAAALVLALVATVFGLTRNDAADAGAAAGGRASPTTAAGGTPSGSAGSGATTAPGSPTTDGSAPGSATGSPDPTTSTSADDDDRGTDASTGTGGGQDDDAGQGGGDDAGQGEGDAVPAGFRAYRDPSGFRVAVPQGWTRSSRGSQVQYQAPSGGAFLRIDQTDDPKGDVLEDWQDQEGPVSRRLADYRRIRIERVDYRDWQAADWEFTWRAGSGRLHVLNRNVRVNDNLAYALYWSVPEGQWSSLRDDFDRVAGSFRAAD